MSDSEDEKNDGAAPAPAAEGGEKKRVAKASAGDNIYSVSQPFPPSAGSETG